MSKCEYFDFEHGISKRLDSYPNRESEASPFELFVFDCIGVCTSGCSWSVRPRKDRDRMGDGIRILPGQGLYEFASAFVVFYFFGDTN